MHRDRLVGKQILLDANPMSRDRRLHLGACQRDGCSIRFSNDVPSANYPALVFGLVQNAIINDTAFNFRPINAQPVRANQRTTFTPLSTVYIWLQSHVSSGTVITHLPRKVAIVTFTGLINAQTFKYDAASGMFVPYSPSKRSFVLNTPHVKLFERMFI
jgi:hypothetical protein